MARIVKKPAARLGVVLALAAVLSLAGPAALAQIRGGRGGAGSPGGMRGGGGEEAEGERSFPGSQQGLDRFTFCAIWRTGNCDIRPAIERGLFETGLSPVFPAGADCPHIDEGYAISYSRRRDREQYHGGIDMPAPNGTPIIAAAAGTVVGKYTGARTFRGIEIVLRHSPEDTGIPLWIYTQYTHFSEMPKHAVGQRVRMGEVLGPTGNTGIDRTGAQSMRRRPAIHYGVFYSRNEKFAALGMAVVPLEGHWMDPVALYRGKLPLDSYAMKALPEEEKRVPIAVMFEDGAVSPPGAKVIWPYACQRK